MDEESVLFAVTCKNLIRVNIDPVKLELLIKRRQEALLLEDLGQDMSMERRVRQLLARARLGNTWRPSRLLQI
jgi:hypothetical protein